MAGYHMTPDEFRRHGREMVDWVADYMERVEGLPVASTVAPGDIRALLPESPPERPEPFEALLADLERVILPGITHWQSPKWFAFFPGNASGPSILGELASAGLGTQGMMWATSPAATELENVVMDWLVDLLDLPPAFKTTGPGGGVILGTASESTFTALAVARHRAGGRPELVAYCSAQAHSSVEKGAALAGIGQVRLVAVDEELAMVPSVLEEAVAADRAAGRTPAAVVSTVGTTGTAAVDPVRAIGEIARRHGAFHHVDAAYAGTAMACPEFRHHQEGLELADSYTFNPHKWMFTNVDCSAFYVADRSMLLDAFTVTPPYLRNEASESGEVIDYRDWHLALGRRFRALKLWFVLRHYGAEGIRHHVREHVLLAAEIASRLDGDPRFEVVAPVHFGLVSFRHVAGDDATEGLAAAINASGDAHLTASRLDDGAYIRVSIGQTHTEQRHVDRLWELIDTLAPA